MDSTWFNTTIGSLVLTACLAGYIIGCGTLLGWLMIWFGKQGDEALAAAARETAERPPFRKAA